MKHGATGTPESTTSAGDLCYRLESNIDLIPAAPPALASPTVPLPAAAIPAAGSSCSGGSGGAKDDCEVVCLASPEKQPADAVALSGAGGGHGLKRAREEMAGSGSEEESGGGKEYAETVTCAICLDLIVDAWSSGCQAGHTFCRECVEPVLRHSPGAGVGSGTAAASSSSSSSASAAGHSECPTCSEPVSGGGRGNVMVNQLVSCMVRNRTIKGDLAAEYERRTGMLVQKKLKTDRKKLLPETQQPEAIETGAAARSGSSSSSSSSSGSNGSLGAAKAFTVGTGFDFSGGDEKNDGGNYDEREPGILLKKSQAELVTQVVSTGGGSCDILGIGGGGFGGASKVVLVDSDDGGDDQEVRLCFSRAPRFSLRCLCASLLSLHITSDERFPSRDLFSGHLPLRMTRAHQGSSAVPQA